MQYRSEKMRNLLAQFLHRHHHFICPIIQQYAQLHRYNFRRAGQQGPTRTLTAAVKRVIKQLLLLCHTSKILQTRKLEKSIFSVLFLVGDLLAASYGSLIRAMRGDRKRPGEL